MSEYSPEGYLKGHKLLARDEELLKRMEAAFAEDDPDDDEEWVEEEDEPVEPLSGEVSTASGGGVEELAGMLLEMTALTTKVAIMLEEADEAEFRALSKRLARFQKAVAELPSVAAPRQSMGFKAE